jgi:hypothetical protein
VAVVAVVGGVRGVAVASEPGDQAAAEQVALFQELDLQPGAAPAGGKDCRDA